MCIRDRFINYARDRVTTRNTVLYDSNAFGSVNFSGHDGLKVNLSPVASNAKTNEMCIRDRLCASHNSIRSVLVNTYAFSLKIDNAYLVQLLDCVRLCDMRLCRVKNTIIYSV